MTILEDISNKLNEAKPRYHFELKMECSNGNTTTWVYDIQDELLLEAFIDADISHFFAVCEGRR